MAAVLGGPPPTVPLAGEPQGMEALCEALLKRLLPAIHSIVQGVAENAATRTVQMMRQTEGSTSQQGGLTLGVLPPGQRVAADWTFTNSGTEPWAAGARLRFLGGQLGPAQGGALQPGSQAPTPVGGRLTVQAPMLAPLEPGPCEAQWQLEAADGVPLAPPLLVQGSVASARSPSQAARSVPASPDRFPQSPVRQAVPVQVMGRSPVGSSPVGVTVAVDGAYRPEVLVAGTPQLTTRMQSQEVRPGTVPLQAAQPSHFQSTSTSLWLQSFEDFFGRDRVPFLRQQAEKELERMLSQVMEYVQKNGLSRSQAGPVSFDAMLLRVYQPVLPVDSRACNWHDLLVLTQRIITKYLEYKGA